MESLVENRSSGGQGGAGVRMLTVGLDDLRAALGRLPLIGLMGWQDVRQRYRRSVIGPFWLTISMAIMIGTIGIVFGQVFHTPLTEFLPFLSIGMVLWSFVSGVISEGCTGFIHAEGIIKQLPMPLFFHMLRLTWRNVIILIHNVAILPLVFIAVGKPIGWIGLLSIVGIFLFIANILWVASVFAVLCARYRDFPQIVGSALQIVFYVSPIIWMPALAPAHTAAYLLNANPLYHLLEIVRSPLMGEWPSMENWIVSATMAVAGWVFTLAVYGRFKQRVPYWL